MAPSGGWGPLTSMSSQQILALNSAEVVKKCHGVGYMMLVVLLTKPIPGNRPLPTSTALPQMEGDVISALRRTGSQRSSPSVNVPKASVRVPTPAPAREWRRPPRCRAAGSPSPAQSITPAIPHFQEWPSCLPPDRSKEMPNCLAQPEGLHRSFADLVTVQFGAGRLFVFEVQSVNTFLRRIVFNC